MNRLDYTVARPAQSALTVNKVLKNTYMLLSATMLFSALMAAVSVVVQMPPMTYLLSAGGAMLLIWLVLPRTANSASGLWVVFAITGLLGFGLGPLLSYYLALPNGPQIVATAFGGTGVIFLGLSGYALTTRKDFSFMGGFLIAGLLMVLVVMLANIFLNIPALSLAISAIVIMIMSGFILYDTSRMVNGGETNYIMMTVSLYLNIYNIFISLLQILGAFSGDD
ncbi:MAG TPA: Bax inhibitor-1/YccA family protein [Sedimenticola thiotaurini]|uniref:Bax inhibitor-1/YccA family protein n=1 Tax=Sedimenticola thiotaurini TaxID=1543721 RepID=A0A831W274_9GAMM|nr:Bax inhibitor-1/YccA family protein [Sedimenticola thiotaurini]